MPYAIDDEIRPDEVPGAIYITEDQYNRAMNAKLAGQKVEVINGELKIYSLEKRTVYSTDDGEPHEIYEDEPTPQGYTSDKRPSEFHEWVNGEWYESPESALNRAQTAARQHINDAYQEELNAILHDYPDAETKTWDKQEQEARAYQVDSSASTPLLDAVATARNMDKTELVSRVIAKADAWISLSGAATGKRQWLEDQINNAATVEAAEAVTW